MFLMKRVEFGSCCGGKRSQLLTPVAPQRQAGRSSARAGRGRALYRGVDPCCGFSQSALENGCHRASWHSGQRPRSFCGDFCQSAREKSFDKQLVSTAAAARRSLPNLQEVSCERGKKRPYNPRQCSETVRPPPRSPLLLQARTLSSSQGSMDLLIA